jgi:hypothetical protein
VIIKFSVNYLNILFPPSFSETSQPAVYNSAALKIMKFTNGEVNKIGIELNEQIPVNGIMWNPTAHSTKYSAWYYLNVIFFHLLPGLLIDGLLKLSGKKPQ